MTTILSNKSKIARRVIEVLEFINENGGGIRITDIVRRYRRPQSSTSELFKSLVEMGILYKEPQTRSYSPTPLLAALAAGGQPSFIRDGQLFKFMDQLAFSTRYAVGLFGVVGTDVQLFRCSAGDMLSAPGVCGGAVQPLSDSTAGLLLLSTLDDARVKRTLWRLNAEASANRKFGIADVAQKVAGFRLTRHATGPSGFANAVNVTASLLPLGNATPPLALGLLYPQEAQVDTQALLATLKRGIAQCLQAGDCEARSTDLSSSFLRAI